MEEPKIHYDAVVESFEIARDKKKASTKFAGKFRVKIEPIGLRISQIRVAQNAEGRIFIDLPATPCNGGWEKNISLSPPLYAAMRAAILQELRDIGIVPDRNDSDAAPPESEPLVFDPDSEPQDDEIPLPKSITGDTSE